MSDRRLAIFGGDKAVTEPNPDIFKWPIVTQEDEAAVLDVIRSGSMSDTAVTAEFEKEFAAWMGRTFAVAYCNGTESLRSAMWACGVGAGDEVICPSITYWASCTQALTLGAAVNFADVDADTLCIDPSDIEHRIGPRTKAIMVVHVYGRPCDMDPIMAVAEKHNVKVIEDVSHAHGALYKGRMVGSIGHVAAMSLMSGKSFAIGEAGIMVTNDPEVHKRCVAYGFYERTGNPSLGRVTPGDIDIGDVQSFAGIPLGGYKHRLNQTCSAMGRVQLKYYPERVAEIDRAMNRFWDLLEGVPGIKSTRPARDSGTTMGGWYCSAGLYRPQEIGGLPIARFCEAVAAEGMSTLSPGVNFPLHLHPIFHVADIFGQGAPTMVAFGQRDVRQGPGTLPVAESIPERAYFVPWFKQDCPETIAQYAAAFRKVAESADQLLEREPAGVG